MNASPQPIDAARLAALTMQLSDLVASQNTPSITLGELFDIYYEKHAMRRHKAPMNAYYFFQRHASKYAQTPVSALTQRELQDWVDSISDERGSVGAKRAIDMLSAVINFGIRRGYVNIYANPCKAVERHAPKARTRFMKPQELARLADVLRDEPAIWRDYVWLSLFTGARRGNVLAMRWEEIDFDLGQWLIPDSKNGEDLFIALTGKAVALLKRRRSEADLDNPWVFPGKGREGHIACVKRMWDRVCRKAGIENLRIHDLRRTLASYLAMQGASSYQIGKALGHRDPRSTAIYARLDLEGVRNEMEKVHNGWLIDCLKEAPPVPAPRLITSTPAPESKANNAKVKIDARKQILIEARVIVALQHGMTTKKQLYSKIGGKLQINSSELDRILGDLAARGIISQYRDESDLKHWQSWRYRLSTSA